jgi:membrane protease YdiL (CAAX protease family)
VDDDTGRRSDLGAPALPGGGVALFAGVLVLYGNGLALLRLPEWLAFLANCTVGVAVVLLARKVGLAPAEIGLSRRAWVPGWRWGAGVAVALSIAVALVILAGPARRFIADPAVLGSPAWLLAWQVLVRIPIGTALFEETMFRGVLYAAWRRLLVSWQAAVCASLPFSLWHVVVEFQRQARQAGELGVAGLASILLVLCFLFAGGLGLCWLRERTAGVIVPAIVHWAANSSAAIAVYLVTN